MSKEHIIKTISRNAIQNLDSMPYLDRSLINNDFYFKHRNHTMFYNTIPLFTTRGCPYSCAYCHSIWPQQHVYRSAENIIEEIKIYYDMGIRRFAFLDDIFNLNRKNSEKFFNEIINQKIDIQILFQNGVRGDILDEGYIDLMVEAGTAYLPMALETASTRLQKLINKNLNIDKLYNNMSYLCKKYPDVISALYFMVGFPTETEEEALATVDFVKSIKWIHTPEYFNLVIYPGTEMEKIALANGISKEDIANSMSYSLTNDEPKTFPFDDKKFAKKLRLKLFKEYWMNRERLETILPGLMKQMTEREITQMYSSWFGPKFNKFSDILKFLSIPEETFKGKKCLDEEKIKVDNLQDKIDKYFSRYQVGFTQGIQGIKILLIDVTQAFHQDETDADRHLIPPIGIMCIATYLKSKLKDKVDCKVIKSKVDYDDYDDLKKIVDEFKPSVIGLSTVTMFKDNMHETAEYLKSICSAPIIVGGAHSSAYEEILKDENIDIVSIGEGELTIKQLIDEFLNNNNKMPDIEILKNIKGIAFRGDI